MFSLPPHTAHRIRSLDELFQKSHPAKKIITSNINPASLMKEALKNLASISEKESGSRSNDIFPFNTEVFKGEGFIASKILQLENIVIQDGDESLAELVLSMSNQKVSLLPEPQSSIQDWVAPRWCKVYAIILSEMIKTDSN